MTIANSQIKEVITAIKSVGGQMKLLVGDALRMTKLRRALEAEEADVQDTVNLLIKKMGDGEKIDSRHANWQAFKDAYDELMAKELELPDSFVLYQRTVKDATEFAWDPHFRTKFTEIEPNLLYAITLFADMEEVETPDA